MNEIPAPVPKIDAAQLVDGVNRATGAGLELVGAAGQGEVGAGFVSWPNGRRGVITRAGSGVDQLEETRATLERLAGAGLPVPVYRLIVDLETARVVVQDRLPGDPPTAWTAALGDQLISLVDRCAGLGADLPEIDLYLRSSGPGFCLHETLAAYDARTRRLLDRIREIGAADRESDTPNDLVHLDFHLGNVLVQGDRITGIVDWDGYGRGDRRMMLVTLLYDLAHRAHVDPEFGLRADAMRPMFDRLHRAPQAAVRRWWAHMALRQVDWTIRHRYPVAEIEHYLRFASEGLDRLDAGEPVG